MLRRNTFIFLLLYLLPIPYSQANESRIALVIGNKDYAKAPLENPINDARDMKSALEKVGFRVIYKENANLAAMDEAVHQFVKSLGKESVGLVYYSGHGAQADDGNYLIPIDAKITSKAELKSRAYDAGIILGEMQEAGNKVNVVILDACRNNPFKGFRGGADGLATMSGPKGSLIAYATAPGSVASDGASGHNGIYTAYLKQYILQPGLSIEEMFKKVLESVSEKNPDQTPWYNSSMTGTFCFAGCSTAPISIAPIVSTSTQSVTHIKSNDEIEQETWESVKASSNIDAMQEYLNQYPKGKFVGQAKILIATLKAPKMESQSVQPIARPAPAQIVEQQTTTVYSLGSKGPGGGIVFNVDYSGAHGLEAQPADYTSQPGDGSDPDEPFYRWEHATTAAGGYGAGWRLPTKNELNLLYQQKAIVAKFFENCCYWSSTVGFEEVWSQSFADGKQYTPSRLTALNRVRAVRAF
jgi:hypothetical protein